MSKENEMTTKVICFSGIDGSGKSSHARLMLKELRAEGINCRYRWLRYPRFFSLIPEALYHLVGSTGKNESSFSSAKTYNAFHSNNAIIDLWLFFQWVDTFLITLKNVYLPTLFGYTIILDRCAIDTLIDNTVSLGKEKLIFGVVGKSFLKLIPNNSLILIFDVNVGVVVFRRRQTGDVDDVDILAKKRALYMSLGKKHCWNIVSTCESFPEVHSKVMKLVQS